MPAHRAGPQQSANTSDCSSEVQADTVDGGCKLATKPCNGAELSKGLTLPEIEAQVSQAELSQGGQPPVHPLELAKLVRAAVLGGLADGRVRRRMATNHEDIAWLKREACSQGKRGVLLHHPPTHQAVAARYNCSSLHTD